MSTNSRIGYLENGQVKSIYCHWDGYTSHNGAILLDHYDALDKVKALVDRSNISSLGSKPLNTKFYDGAQEYPTLEDFASFKENAYYHYLFDMKNNEWTLFHDGETYKLSDVVNSYDTFCNVESFIDNKKEFDRMQDFREALNNGYQSWTTPDHDMIYSCYIPEDNAIEIIKSNFKFDADIATYIPCENIQQALSISDTLVGKTYEAICEEYNLPLGYLSVDFTNKELPLFEILSNELDKELNRALGIVNVLSVDSFKIDINTASNEVRLKGIYTKDNWGSPITVDKEIPLTPDLKERLLNEFCNQEQSLGEQIKSAIDEKQDPPISPSLQDPIL